MVGLFIIKMLFSFRRCFYLDLTCLFIYSLPGEFY